MLMCHINKFKDSNLRSSWLKFAPVERLIEGKILELNGANRLETAQNIDKVPGMLMCQCMS